VSEDDRAPRWLVRWLWTLVLLVVIVGEAYLVWWETGINARLERSFHMLSCDMATQFVRMETDPWKIGRLARRPSEGLRRS